MNGKILDIIVKAFPKIYMDEELGKLLYEFAIRRKRKGLSITVEYIKWLRKQIK